MSNEERRPIAHAGGVPSEQRTKILISCIVALKLILPDKHAIAAMKTGNAIYGYEERSNLLKDINRCCLERCKALTVEEHDQWKNFCELESVCNLWDMLSDIQHFGNIVDLTYVSSFAFYVEYITLRIFESQTMMQNVYSQFI